MSGAVYRGRHPVSRDGTVNEEADPAERRSTSHHERKNQFVFVIPSLDECQLRLQGRGRRLPRMACLRRRLAIAAAKTWSTEYGLHRPGFQDPSALQFGKSRGPCYVESSGALPQAKSGQGWSLAGAGKQTTPYSLQKRQTAGCHRPGGLLRWADG